MTPPLLAPAAAPLRTAPRPAHAPPVPVEPGRRPAAFGLPAARVGPADAGTPLRIDVDDRGDEIVLRVDGEIDMLTVGDLRAALDGALGSAARTVVADLRRVAFVDCGGIGLLADARARAHDRGLRLRVVAGRAVARTAAVLDLGGALGLDERE